MAENLALPYAGSKSIQLVPATVGSSLGTLLLLFAKNLSDKNPIKSWLIIACPTLAVLVTWVAKFIEKEFKKAKIRSLQNKLRKRVEIALQNKGLSEFEREKYRQTLNEIEKYTIDIIAYQIKNLTTEVHE